ncbi:MULTISPECIES: N-acetylglucosamine-6-phosphate deacetylase [unclassified Virgibacillus]|uniref:N-acetylglucosamine-6-phosphate deacetylase n=1 Tax=unclassified Virgibacillus TaxID=2620237 RepID=UPI0024DF05A4|nr:N-acetylglucosamine-6-phosphate deacetylase [Virgibacillus sp. LDC-1]
MPNQTSLYLTNVTVYTEDGVIENGSLLLENGQIKQIYSDGRKPESYPPSFKIIDGTGLNAIPGFIDGHIHGANGADVMDATEEALDKMALVLPREGTTSFLATTITQSPENITRALKNVAQYTSKSGQAEIIGVHLEGPFIEASKKGAQPLEYIMKPSIEQFKKWQQVAQGSIKTITMAPELDEDGSFIRYLAETGVNVSAGHTDAGIEEMKKAVANGVRQVTHICNAMNGIHHRDIGAVGAAFQLEALRAELIADGIHVSPEMMQIIYQNMGSERLILITDAMRAKCLHAGDYELGGQPVTVTEDRAVLQDGTLAGSILKMNEGVQQMLRLRDVTIQNVVEMASMNPAKQLGVFDRKGSISVGKDADVLLVDNQINIKLAVCRGVVAYEEEK